MKKLIAILACATLITACSAGNQTKTSKQEALDTVRVTYVQSPLNVPSIIEKDQKMFEKSFDKLGSKMEYSDLTTGPEQTQALASGDIQFLNAVGSTSVILAASNGSDIQILSAYSRSPKGFMMFSKDASINSPLDLKGKKIAGPKGTILHELLVAYLKSGGLTQDDVELISMGLPDAQAALENGSVDVALLAGPLAYNATKAGFHKITDGQGYTSALIVTAASKSFIKKHPDYVKAFLATQKESIQFIDKNLDKALSITQKATELDETAVKDMYALYDFSPKLTKKDIQSLKDTQDFMYANQMIETKVNINQLIAK